MKRHASRIAGVTMAYIVLIVVAAFVLFPLIWTLFTSVKPGLQVFEVPPVWIPNPPTFENYTALAGTDFVLYLRNSAIVTAVSTVITLLIGAPAAYAFAKAPYPLSGVLFLSILAVRMFPPVIFTVPFFFMMTSVGLVDSLLGLVVAYLPLQLTLVVWILEGFFRGIPREIEEAAEVDGLGLLGRFVRIALPLSLPAIGVSAIFAFIISWNEFIYALVLTRSTDSQTMPIGIAGNITQFRIDWGSLAAFGVLYILPAILFTMVAQRGLIKGLTAGATKG